MWPNLQFADLVTFTEEILNGKLHFLRSDSSEVLVLREAIVGVFTFSTNFIIFKI